MPHKWTLNTRLQINHETSGQEMVGILFFIWNQNLFIMAGYLYATAQKLKKNSFSSRANLVRFDEIPSICNKNMLVKNDMLLPYHLCK